MTVAERLGAARASTASDLVVCGNAVTRDNPEAAAARERGLRTMSFPQALEELFLAGAPAAGGRRHARQDHVGVDAAFVLERCGRDPGWLIGGAPRDLPPQRPPRRQPVVRRRGRRVRLRVLRQGSEVPPLPAGHAAADGGRVRPRRHLPRPRRREGGVPQAARPAASRRAAGGLRRLPACARRRHGRGAPRRSSSGSASATPGA